MSTRCQIAFYTGHDKDLPQFDALIYRHWDGYPSGVLPDLLPVLRDFHQHRGLGDVEYASAWLVSRWKNYYLNIGISKWFHGDIEWLYAVYPDGKVDVYKVEGYGDERQFTLADRKKVYALDEDASAPQPIPISVA